MNLKFNIINLVFSMLFVFSSPAGAGTSTGKTCPPLKTCKDTSLQKGLEASISKLGLDKAVFNKTICISLVDITEPDRPKMAGINENQMMYAASLPKIAILLGAFERIKNGDMQLDSETRATLTKMIRNSCNRSASEMFNRVGKDYLARLLQSPKYRLYAPEWNGGLWVGKAYGKTPAWKRDPLHNLSHGATAMQVARFYYMLENGLLVSPEMSREMKKILGRPAICHKFVKGLKQSCPDAAIFRKSGTWREYHSDSAIIEHHGRRYIAVALARSPEGGGWLPEIIQAMDSLIFQYASGPENYIPESEKDLS